jgi:hypothetical protein
MSRLKEQRLWDRFSANMKRPGIKLFRVENLVGDGFPDVLVITRQGPTTRGVVAMIELKAVEAAPVRPTTPLLGDKVGASREQRNWHLEWTHLGGTSYFLVGVGSKTNLLVPGHFHDEINRFPLQTMQLAACAQTWDTIYTELMMEKK